MFYIIAATLDIRVIIRLVRCITLDQRLKAISACVHSSGILLIMDIGNRTPDIERTNWKSHEGDIPRQVNSWQISTKITDGH